MARSTARPLRPPPEELASAREQLDLALKRLPDLGSPEIGIFGRVIDPAKLHFPATGHRCPRLERGPRAARFGEQLGRARAAA
jgi:hypothetical protein